MWDLSFEPHLGSLEYFVTSGKPHRMHIYQRKKNVNRRALTLFCTSNSIKTEWQNFPFSITVENCLVLQIIKFPQGEGDFHAVKSLLHGLRFSNIFLACILLLRYEASNKWHCPFHRFSNILYIWFAWVYVSCIPVPVEVRRACQIPGTRLQIDMKDHVGAQN